MRLSDAEPLNLLISDRIFRKSSSGWRQSMKFYTFWDVGFVVPRGAGVPKGYGDVCPHCDIRRVVGNCSILQITQQASHSSTDLRHSMASFVP